MPKRIVLLGLTEYCTPITVPVFQANNGACCTIASVVSKVIVERLTVTVRAIPFGVANLVSSFVITRVMAVCVRDTLDNTIRTIPSIVTFFLALFTTVVMPYQQTRNKASTKILNE